MDTNWIEDLRTDLHDQLEQGLVNDEVEIYPESISRSFDPSIVGTISLILAPMLVEKMVDLIIKWTDRHEDCSITIHIPVKDASPITITYDPRTVSKTRLKEWISESVESARLNLK